eukprot:GHVU01007175.1.p1 GENE.GHVU01007175.1~~GHVU01007175.1.p1  ORF type:complete len:151 (+),score=23.38 GHVU01007175.1:252-704(+)
MRCRRGGYKFFFMRSRSCLCGHSFGLKSPRVAPAECNYRCGLAGGGGEVPPEYRLDDDDDDDDDETTIPIRTPCGGREAISAFDTRGPQYLGCRRVPSAHMDKAVLIGVYRRGDSVDACVSACRGIGYVYGGPYGRFFYKHVMNIVLCVQ